VVVVVTVTMYGRKASSSSSRCMAANFCPSHVRYIRNLSATVNNQTHLQHCMRRCSGNSWVE
jgi:hypothetical protein